MSSRILLESGNPEIFNQEIQTAMGQVIVGRLIMENPTSPRNTMLAIPTEAGETIRVRTIMTARQIGGTAGNIGDSGAWEIITTFKNVNGICSKVGASTIFSAQTDNANLTLEHDEHSDSNIYVQCVASFEALEANKIWLWNGYNFIHTLSE